MSLKERIVPQVDKVLSEVKPAPAAALPGASSPAKTNVTNPNPAEVRPVASPDGKLVASPVNTAPVAGEPGSQPAAVVEPVAPVVDDSEKSRTSRRFQELLEENRRLKAAQASPVAVAAAAPVTAAVDENSPEYWFKQYNDATDLRSKQVAYAKWMDARDKKLVADVKVSLNADRQQAEISKKITGKFEAIHKDFPYLVTADNGQKVLDNTSPIVQRAVALANSDEVPIQSDTQLLYYLQEARAQLLTERANTATTHAQKLETKVQSTVTRQVLQPPTVGAQPPAAATDAAMKQLEERSRGGDVEATRELLRLRL